MQLCGQPVKHKSFGKGIITDCTGHMVTICFARDQKRFLYPDAFTHFLMLKDPVMQAAVNEEHRLKIQAQQKKEAQKRAQQEWMLRIRTMKISACAQAAFDLPAGDAAGQIASGSVSTGCYLSGPYKGTPKCPSRMKPNSACLLTTIPPQGQESDRRIEGFVMVRHDFLGNQCHDGRIKAHETYRIALPSDLRPSYWDYFQHGESFPHWGRVTFKYFSTDIMHTILHDAAQKLTGTAQQETAEAFLEYFREMNRL